MRITLLLIMSGLIQTMTLFAQEVPFFKVVDPFLENHYINDKATNIFQIDSFYYLVNGFSDAIPGRSQQILKLDRTGTIVQEAFLDGPFNDLIIAEGGGHFVTHDGYILFTGEWYNPETDKMGAFLIKMDTSLQVLWSKYYTNPTGNGNYYGASVVETDDGQHYLLYASNKSTYLLKTDTSGTFLWSKVIPDNVPQSINGNMIKTQDGHVLITTYVYDPTLVSYNYTASMAKVDYEGNLIWRKDVDNYTTAGEQQEPMATLLNNGGFAIMWANDSLPWIPYVTQPYFPSLYILDSDGVKQREVRFDRYGLRSVFGLITAANGDIIAAGYNYEASEDEDKGWLFRATPAGDILWERYYSDSLQRPWSPIYFYDVTETADGHIICVGFIEDSIPGIGINVNRNVNMALLVTDADGCLISGCPDGLQYITAVPEAPEGRASLPWLEVAPNPVQAVLKVSLPDRMQHASARLQLFNTLGRLVAEQEVESTTSWQEINVQAIPSGFYSLLLKENGRVVARNKIVIQH